MYKDMITPVIAQNVLNFMGETKGNVAPGNFFQALYVAASCADSTNFAKLLNSFPVEMTAFNTARNVTDGIAILRKIARS